MEVYAVQVVTAMFIFLMGFVMKAQADDIKQLQLELRNTLTKEEVKEQIKLTNLPIRVEIEHIREDMSEIKGMLQRILDEKG